MFDRVQLFFNFQIGEAVFGFVKIVLPQCLKKCKGTAENYIGLLWGSDIVHGIDQGNGTGTLFEITPTSPQNKKRNASKKQNNRAETVTPIIFYH